jgi:hypothetical protein
MQTKKKIEKQYQLKLELNYGLVSKMMKKIGLKFIPIKEPMEL